MLCEKLSPALAGYDSLNLSSPSSNAKKKKKSHPTGISHEKQIHTNKQQQQNNNIAMARQNRTTRRHIFISDQLFFLAHKRLLQTDSEKGKPRDPA